MKQYYVAVIAGYYKVYEEYPGINLPANTTHFFTVNASSEANAIAKLLSGEGGTLMSPEGKKLKMVDECNI